MKNPRQEGRGPEAAANDIDNRRNSTPATTPATITITLRAERGVDPVKALRGALKLLLRRFGLRALSIEERR
jgi:hypothetical protein